MRRMHGRLAALAITLSLTWLGTGALDAAATSPHTSAACADHAAAMVAEMQATRETPLSPDERDLVHRTALRSCLAQTAAKPSADDAADTERTPASADHASSDPAEAATQSDDDDGGFWSMLTRLPKSRERTAGHQRLQRRGRY